MISMNLQTATRGDSFSDSPINPGISFLRLRKDIQNTLVAEQELRNGLLEFSKLQIRQLEHPFIYYSSPVFLLAFTTNYYYSCIS